MVIIKCLYDNMNRVSLHINELGPVKGQKIDLAPVMLFTGESSLGKSYVNFLSYYVFNVFSSQRLDKFLEDHFPSNIAEISEFHFELPVKEIVSWMKDDVQDFFVYLYHYDKFKCDVDFEFHSLKNTLKFDYKNVSRPKNDNDFFGYETVIDGWSKTYFTLGQSIEQSISISLRKMLCSLILGLDVKRALLLPPGRASLLTGDYSTQRASSRLGLYDLFLRDNDWINSRRLRNLKRDDINENLAKQMHNLIKGTLVSEKEGLFLLVDGNKEPIPIDAAASSIREMTPLIQWVLGGPIDGQSICLEEPEAHLHPEMQIGIADLLVACIQEGTIMQITSHSDYFLQRINQLLKYWIIREKNRKEYDYICDVTGHNPELYLDSSLLKTYYFSKEGDYTKISSLEVDENGIPMSTFFSAVEKLSRVDDVLNDELEKSVYHA